MAHWDCRDCRDSRPISAQIADGIREQILRGILRPGDKLPGVQELAVSQVVNPAAIRQAYHQLEVEGWITTLPEKGSFVCGNGEGQEEQLRRWLATLDEAVAILTELGVSKEQLWARVEKGGRRNA